jgi:hypothetical protein
MSDPNEQTPSLAKALPGYTLHQLTNEAIGEVEDALQRWHIHRAAGSTWSVHADIRKEVIAQTITEAAWAYVNGTAAFRRATDSAEGRLATILAAIGVGGTNVDESDVRDKLNAMDIVTLKAACDWCWRRTPATTATAAA